MPFAPHSGFSLIELSIVLVILGLLTGGILGGQSLIRAAELRAVTTEYSRYYAATHAFKDKYFQLPGDMNNATSVWGVAGGTGNDTTCRDTASTDAKTCNGNGDNMINAWTGAREMFRFWQHLANAGMIEGSYTGRHDSTDALKALAGSNAPATKVNASGVWFAYYYGSIPAGVGNMFQGEYGNGFELAVQGASNPYGVIVKPEEIWNIDTKIDDGKPGAGKLYARGGGGISNCTTAVTDTSAAAAAADYKLTNNTLACSFVFRQQF